MTIEQRWEDDDLPEIISENDSEEKEKTEGNTEEQ